MRRMILIGGGEIQRRETERVDRIAIESTGKPSPVVLFFPTAASDSEGYCAGFRSYYESLGSKVDFAILSSMDDALILKKIAAADLIYLSGGDTETLIDAFKARPKLLHALRNKNGVIAGMSAGALALCAECFISKDNDNPTTKLIPGLGFVPITIEVHYTGANADELNEFSQRVAIFAIPEQCAIIIEDNIAKFIGEVKYFMKKASDED